MHSLHTGEKIECMRTVDKIFIDFEETYDSVREELLYNSLIEFCVPMKLLKLIKMCLKETYSEFRIN